MTFLPVNPMAILGWQRYLVYGALALALLAVAWIHGYSRGEKKLWEYQAKQAKAAVAIVTKRGAVTTKVVTRYVRVAADADHVADEVKKGVQEYAKANAGYCLDARWRGLHDDSAANRLPDPTGQSYAALGAPKASEALDTVTANYAACIRTADRLDALQEWVREQEKVR